MTAPGPNSAVVAAVRERVANSLHGDCYDGLDGAARHDVDTAVRVTLVEALPVLRAQWAEEVAGAIGDKTPIYEECADDPYTTGVRYGMYEAQRIALAKTGDPS